MDAGDFLFESNNIDSRGELSSVELTKLTGKEFKRYFVISNIKGGKRGGHAHIYTDQVLKMIKGSMNLCYETKYEKKSINLDHSCSPIYLPRLTWVEMKKITVDAIILVLSSDEYNIKNSLRSYEDFQNHLIKLSNV